MARINKPRPDTPYIQRQRAYSRKNQRRLRTDGFCPSCSAPIDQTDINVYTGRPYWRCLKCRERHAEWARIKYHAERMQQRKGTR